MTYMIGNAWCDENGNATGGKAGDQIQQAVHDYKGEVRQQAFYKSSKGWYVERLKSAKQAIKARKLMVKACDNVNIGYSQSDRYGVIKKGVATKEPVNCDCSSLVREVLREATGVEIPDFYTANEISVLSKTGLFEESINYSDGTTLYEGDVIVTRTKGHTAIVTEGESRKNTYPKPKVAVTSKSIARAEGIEEFVYKGDTVKWVQYQLCKAGFQQKIDNAGGIDGVCGSGTTNCIQQFQKEHDLEVDGICGKKTRKALAKI